MSPFNLPFYIYRLAIEPIDPIRLGPVPGQQLHSVLSEGLRDAACLRLDDPARDCRDCVLRTPALHRQCAVPPLLDPPVYLASLRSARGIGTAPPPFVLAADGRGFPPAGRSADVAVGFPLEAYLTLFGRAHENLRSVVSAIRLSGWKRRLGERDRDSRAQVARPGRFALRRIDGLEFAPATPPHPDNAWWPASPTQTPVFALDGRLSLPGPSVTPADLHALAARIADARRVVLRLASPLRLRVGKRYADDLDPSVFLTRLRDRAAWLTFFHASGAGSAAPPPVEPATLPSGVEVVADTALVSAHRSHGRPAHGLVGELTFEALTPGALAPLASLLAVAPWIGCGQLASMGFGRLAITSIEA